MVYINNKMLELIASCSEKNVKSEYEESILAKYSNFINIGECIIVDEEHKGSYNANFQMLEKVYGDLTGYEASRNHFHLESVFNELDIKVEDGLRLGLLLLEKWKDVLLLQYPEDRFVVTLVCCDNDVNIRLNKFREDEGYWIDPNRLEEYEEGIAVDLINFEK